MTLIPSLKHEKQYFQFSTQAKVLHTIEMLRINLTKSQAFLYKLTFWAKTGSSLIRIIKMNSNELYEIQLIFPQSIF